MTLTDAAEWVLDVPSAAVGPHMALRRAAAGLVLNMLGAYVALHTVLRHAALGWVLNAPVAFAAMKTTPKLADGLNKAAGYSPEVALLVFGGFPGQWCVCCDQRVWLAAACCP